MPEFEDNRRKIKDLFSELFDISVDDIDIDSQDAEDLVSRRLKNLSSFVKNDYPPDIITAFRQAIDFTSTGHDLCKIFVKLSEHVYPLTKYSSEALLALARIELEKKRNHIDKRISSIQKETFDIIMTHLKSKKESVVIRDVISERFKNNPPAEILAAGMEATLLLANYDNLAVQKDLMLAATDLGNICRGLFYRAIVDHQGSGLEVNAKRRAVEEKLQDLSWDALGLVTPVIGDFIGMAKNVIQLIITLIDREGALNSLRANLSNTYTMTKDFIDSYLLALGAWAEWATALQNAVLDIVKSGAPRFSISGAQNNNSSTQEGY